MDREVLVVRLTPVVLAVACLAVGAGVAGVPAAWSAGERDSEESASPVFGQEQLRADLRSLVGFLDAAHPDPYTRGGGRLGFHRLVSDIEQQLPTEGLTRQQFYELLLPVVAGVRDGHTRLHKPRSIAREPGLPFLWRIFDSGMYVDGVFEELHLDLLGARLVAIDRVAYAELVERQGRRRGYDNQYDNLRHVSYALARAYDLQHLLPEWDTGPSIEVRFQLTDGEEVTRRISLATRKRENERTLPTQIELPDNTRWDPAYGFLSNDKRVAVFRNDTMMEYREAFESWYESGNWGDSRLRAAQRLYRRAHDKEPPESVVEVIAGIPSATETILSLFREMKEAETPTLIVDLRQNQGGNSLISWIFSYVMVGSRRAMENRADRYQIRRYSQLYFDNNSNRTMEQVREATGEELQVGDYTFEDQRNYEAVQAGTMHVTDDARLRIRAFLEQYPSCKQLFHDGWIEAMYKPKNLIVLCSNRTYSAGFDLLVDLYKNGAVLVGTPSAQTANCFIDSIRFELPETGLTGNLSCKYRELFPGDDEKGEVLEPHHRLTYEQWAAYDFDPHAELLLALELLERGRLMPAPAASTDD